MRNKSWLAGGVWVTFFLLAGLILNNITGKNIFWTLAVLIAVLGLFVIIAIDWRYKWL